MIANLSSCYQLINDEKLFEVRRPELWILPNYRPTFKFSVHMSVLPSKLYELGSHPLSRQCAISIMSQIWIDGIIGSIVCSILERYLLGVPLELLVKIMFEIIRTIALSQNAKHYNKNTKLMMIQKNSHQKMDKYRNRELQAN